MKQIKILGAGIAGTCAAIQLAQAGYDVAVFEKNKKGEDRYLGDLQGIENWTEKEDVLQKLARMGIEINFDCTPFSELTITDGLGTTAHFQAERPFLYLVKRGAVEGSLERGLRAQAVAAGVKIHYEQTIPETKADIIATGPISRQIFVIDKGIVFKTRARDRVIGLVNNKAAPRGYAYLLITNGYGCLSSILFDRFGEIHTCFAEAQRLFLNMADVDIQEPHAVGGVGSFSTVPLRQKRSGVVVGEAAGIQDMLWGFGIKNALISGFMAAKSILDQENYEAMASRFFGDKMKASIVNRFIWETFGRDGYSFLLRLTASRKDPLRFLYLTHKFTVLHRLLYPLAVTRMRQRYPHLKM